MPKPSSATIVQIVRVAGSRSMRAEIVPALKPAAPLSFMFPLLASPARMPRAFGPSVKRALSPVCQIRSRRLRQQRPSIGRLSLVQHCAIDAPWTAASKGEIEEYEAEQDRQFSRVDDRVKRARRVRHKIGEGHFAREDERHDPGIGADEKQESAEGLKERGENEETAQRSDRRGGGKSEPFRKRVLQKQEPNDNARKCGGDRASTPPFACKARS